MPWRRAPDGSSAPEDTCSRSPLLTSSDQSSATPDHSRTSLAHFQVAHTHSQVTQPRSSLTSRPPPNHSS